MSVRRFGPREAVAGPMPTGLRSSSGKGPTAQQVTNLVAIVLPFAAFGFAVVVLWGGPIQWIDLAVLVVGYVVTCLGIAVGFHRLLTHRSFRPIPPFALAGGARHVGGGRLGDQVGGRSPQAPRLRRRGW